MLAYEIFQLKREQFYPQRLPKHPSEKLKGVRSTNASSNKLQRPHCFQIGV